MKLFFLFFVHIFPIYGKNIDYLNQMYADHLKLEIIENTEKTDQAISKLIKMPELQRKRIAVLINMASLEYNLDPKLFLAIIYVESRFDQNATNKTGDFSLAQINYKVWKKGFPKLNLGHLNFTKLKEDEAYAIYRMAQILSYLKENFSKKDPYWFALYHSATPKFKQKYIQLLKNPIKKIQSYDIKKLEIYAHNKTDLWDDLIKKI